MKKAITILFIIMKVSWALCQINDNMENFSKLSDSIIVKKQKEQNLFEKALLNDQIFEFVTGKGEYYVFDRDFEEHWPLQSYKTYIVPYFSSKGLDHFEERFWVQVIKELNQSKDIALFLDYLTGYFIAYYDSSVLGLQPKRSSSTPESFVKAFKSTFMKHSTQLKADKRGVGADWNEFNKGLGIFGGVLSHLDNIRKRGGIDLVPEECEYFFNK